MNTQNITRNKSADTPFLRRNKKLIFTLVFVALWIVAIVFGLQITKISRVECFMQDDKVCEEAVQAEFNGLRGSSLFSFYPNDIEKKVKRARPEVQYISYKKILPNTLRVLLVSYPESFQFSSTGNPPYAIVNEAGVVMSVEQDLRDGAVYTLATASSRIYSPGEKLEGEIGNALVVVAQAVKKTSLRVRICRYANQDEITCTLETNRMFLIHARDVDKELTTLQRILNDATMNEYMGVIDVRFAQPVFRE
ncbi:MAG: hypothetical protein UX35_C0007G0026 [Microgenomates group bacterium GW2011_GWA1_46_15]|nr:MAG: hypothetical protein UX00_C0009G0038 [Microgenomates group bacterium GW2011_GWB1_45_17]KKU23288.1 MAG: hypothetical protein UX35_C0007G0026 [Microgenomates group bacterium GW2011_GWA1_46_15]KKU23457.1 MAG: hypothetical protein UX36_C0005G0038 [Microgenomates group bacterium GW2011_GWC1_46_15]